MDLSFSHYVLGLKRTKSRGAFDCWLLFQFWGKGVSLGAVKRSNLVDRTSYVERRLLLVQSDTVKICI